MKQKPEGGIGIGIDYYVTKFKHEVYIYYKLEKNKQFQIILTKDEVRHMIESLNKCLLIMEGRLQ